MHLTLLKVSFNGFAILFKILSAHYAIFRKFNNFINIPGHFDMTSSPSSNAISWTLTGLFGGDTGVGAGAAAGAAAAAVAAALPLLRPRGILVRWQWVYLKTEKNKNEMQIQVI